MNIFKCIESTVHLFRFFIFEVIGRQKIDYLYGWFHKDLPQLLQSISSFKIKTGNVK